MEVFVSHTHKDKDLVQGLKNKLDQEFKNSIKLFISSDKKLGPGAGGDWHQWIHHKIDNCHVMLVVITSNTKDSEWIGNEIGYAQKSNKDIMPIRINKDCKIPGTVGTIQVIKDDNNESNEFTDDLYQQIIDELKKKLSKVKENEMATNLLSILVAGPIGFFAKKVFDEVRRK